MLVQQHRRRGPPNSIGPPAPWKRKTKTFHSMLDACQRSDLKRNSNKGLQFLTRIYFKAEFAPRIISGAICARTGSSQGAASNHSAIFGMIRVNPWILDTVEIKVMTKVQKRQSATVRHVLIRRPISSSLCVGIVGR